MVAEGLGKERNFYYGGRRRSKTKKKNGGGGGVKILALLPPPPPTPTVYSNSKSNMAGRINDRELITLAPTNSKSNMAGRINDRELIMLAPTNKKHTLQAMKRVMLRTESNNFALAVQPLPSRKKCICSILIQATI